MLTSDKDEPVKDKDFDEAVKRMLNAPPATNKNKKIG